MVPNGGERYSCSQGSLNSRELSVSVRLGLNVASLQVERRLSHHTHALGRVYERLSSGQRINRAVDDAAGLSIGSALKAESRIYTTAIRNINDGFSVANIVDSALEELSLIAVRIAELSGQAASGVYSAKQRLSLDNEAQALADEYARIAGEVGFNGLRLLDGSISTVSIQAGTDSSTNSQLTLALSSAATRVAGDGTFTAGALLPAVADPTQVTVGDLNNDGNLDIFGTSLTGGVRTFFGNGDGTFNVGASYTISGGSATNTPAILADLDNDGDLDMLTTNSLLGSSVRLNDGTGAFGSEANYFSGHYDMVLADMNNDNVLDIVGAVNTGNGLRIAFGNGNGTFKDTVSFATTAQLTTFDIADVNGDNINDLVGVENVSNSLHVRLGVGDGTFKTAVSYATLLTSNDDAVLTDVNNDGALDFVSVGGSVINLRFGNSNGTFKAVQTLSAGSGLTAVRAADLNSDGFDDLVVSNNTGGTVGVLLNDGTGTFAAMLSFNPGAAPESIGIGDFNEDGALDIVTDGSGATNDFRIFIANGNVVSGIAPFSLQTRQEAREALDFFRELIQEIARDRGSLGSQLSRMSVALTNNLTARENIDTSASRILDADVGLEASELVRLGILQNAAAGVMAQTNLQSEIALTLLAPR